MMNLIEFLIKLIFSPQIFIPFIYPGLITLLVVLLSIIWLERKMAAKVQLRYGPLYVAKHFGGAIQLLADAVRYYFQELIVPERADKAVFLSAPLFTFLVALAPIIFVPPAPHFHAINISYDVIAALAFASLTPIMIITISWSANNKFTILGGMREAYMVIGYEVSLMFSALSMTVLYKTLSFEAIIDSQKYIPGAILNPIAAIAFFIAMLMSSGKLPFDIVEGEQEIVAGPYTEFSGIIYGIMMGASYTQLYSLSLIFVALFLGGWYPIIYPLLQLYPPLGGVFFFIKVYIVMAFIAFLRAVYGRVRLDQAINLGWSKILFLAIISVILSLLYDILGVIK